MPANIKANLEREAQSLAHEVAVKAAEEKRQKIMRRYKGVRFFGTLPKFT
jgi:hypothetical protein